MKPVCLIIMDGWGISPAHAGNATLGARTPVLDALKKKYPTTSLKCSGLSVGLPEGQMGNSEVGHLTMGAGRVIFQDLTRINQTVADGSFATNPLLTKTIQGLVDTDGTLHVMGLLSDGGVHSHIEHLYATIRSAKAVGLKKLYIHAFLDGRDTPPRSAIAYMQELLSEIEEIGLGAVASISGRYWAMDRDTRWERVEKAYRAIADGCGLKCPDPLSAIEEAYARGENDEFIQPTVITKEGEGPARIRARDSVFFFNFRADRARELTRAFMQEGFDAFDIKGAQKVKSFITMTEYDERMPLPALYPKVEPKFILGEVLSHRGIAQFRVSETEKYAHVTFFFNGGTEKAFPLEDRELIDSNRDVATYDLAPAMRAIEIANVAKRVITGAKNKRYGFVLMNFANGDMVGHSGIMDAAIEACETVDRAVGIVVDAALENGFVTIITADHGNAEEMIETNSGETITAHSTNPVPFILVGDDYIGIDIESNDKAGLADIAPTILKIMGIDRPGEMQGRSLI